MVLVPRYGGAGAAIATIIGYAIAGYFTFFVLPETRKVAIIFTKAIFFPWKYLR